MEIKIIEKVRLTREEMNALDKACTIIEDLYRMTPSQTKLDKQVGDLLTSLSDFIDDVEVILEDN